MRLDRNRNEELKARSEQEAEMLKAIMDQLANVVKAIQGMHRSLNEVMRAMAARTV